MCIRDRGTTASYTIAIPEEDSYVYGSPNVTVNIKRDYTWLNIEMCIRDRHGGDSHYMGYNWHKDILNAWTPENRNTNIPRVDAIDKYRCV